MSLSDLRHEYTLQSLDEDQVARDALEQFRRWFDEALAAQLPEPTAMSLATVAADGRPSARIVLLKSFDADGFVFYTNYGSRKGRELFANHQACLLFHWAELERQVRIEGSVAKIPPQDSDAYFRSRPLASRLGAWASPQSEPLPDRAALEKNFHDAAARYGGDPPRPQHWGGYRLAAEAIEFWQGRASRLHDRIRYRRSSTGGWLIERLAP